MAAGLPPTPRHDLIDVLERVLTGGLRVETSEDTVTDQNALGWIRISIAGVDIVKVGAGVAWHYLLEGGSDGEPAQIKPASRVRRRRS